MYSDIVTIKNTTGLHARPASSFVGKANEFKSKLTIKKVGAADSLNAKSIIMILSGAFTKGTVVEIVAEGEDEVNAVKALINFINSIEE